MKNYKLSQALKGNTNAAKNHVKKAIGAVTGGIRGAKIGARVGGALESARDTVGGAAKGAKIGFTMGIRKGRVENAVSDLKAAGFSLFKPRTKLQRGVKLLKNGANIAAETVKGTISGTRGGAKGGALRAKLSPMGEIRGAVKGAKIGAAIGGTTASVKSQLSNAVDEGRSFMKRVRNKAASIGSRALDMADSNITKVRGRIKSKLDSYRKK